MRSFSELISSYIQRTGVPDTELARRLGVSRQTIFRWRAGHTRRPRHRQDVIDLASKLRLSGSERDELLLAAGFRPESDTSPTVSIFEEADGPAIHSDRLRPAPRRLLFRDRRRWLLAGLAFLLLLVLLIYINPGSETMLRHIGLLPGPKAAQQGETLILLSEFANFGGEGAYNVPGRLQSSLDEVFRVSGLTDVRFEQIGVVTDEQAAQDWLKMLDAALVIWGEYDSGQVLARINTSDEDGAVGGEQRRWLIAGGEELSSTINIDLPNEVSWISLYVLGRERFAEGDYEGARAALQQSLLDPPVSMRNLAPVNFYLGLMEQTGVGGSADRAIAYYSEAISLNPAFVAAINNRAMAYLGRSAAGDLDRAGEDLSRSVEQQSEFAEPYYNLALVRVWQDPENLETSLELLEQALTIAPNSANTQNALCWYLSLSGDPASAIHYCDRAVQLGSTQAYDSRGLTHALLGENRAAISDFDSFLERLKAEGAGTYDRYLKSRSLWIEKLEAGENPFDQEVIDLLLRE